MDALCKDSQDIPYNASAHITNQILAAENIVISIIYVIKTKKIVKSLYFGVPALRQNLPVLKILDDFKSDKDLTRIKKQIRDLDQPSRELILKYPIDKKSIEKETKLIDELKQIRTKLINKERGIDSASAEKSINEPSSNTKPFGCWSMFSISRSAKRENK